MACLDCHTNGHTNAATHTVGDIRPNEHRRRMDTPSLRGQTLFFGNNQCATCHVPPYLHDHRLLTLEDTMEFFNLVLDLKLNEHEKSELVLSCARCKSSSQTDCIACFAQPGALDGRCAGTSETV